MSMSDKRARFQSRTLDREATARRLRNAVDRWEEAPEQEDALAWVAASHALIEVARDTVKTAGEDRGYAIFNAGVEGASVAQVLEVTGFTRTRYYQAIRPVAEEVEGTVRDVRREQQASTG